MIDRVEQAVVEAIRAHLDTPMPTGTALPSSHRPTSRAVRVTLAGGGVMDEAAVQALILIEGYGAPAVYAQARTALLRAQGEWHHGVWLGPIEVPLPARLDDPDTGAPRWQGLAVINTAWQEPQ